MSGKVKSTGTETKLKFAWGWVCEEEQLQLGMRDLWGGDKNILTLEFGNGGATMRASPSGSVVKNPTTTQKRLEIQTQSLSQEDPLEKRMATLSSILA